MQYDDLVKNLVKLRGNGNKALLNEAFVDAFKKKNWTFPEDQTLLVAGTNGKGSVSFLVHKILQSHGLKVGLFTSPHLLDLRERIQINSKPISRSEFMHIYDELKTRDELRDLSFYEVLLSMALEYFKSRCDFIVLEVGLGGREDPSNLVPHRWSVITSISHDHIRLLGPKLEDIARHKFGILSKQGVCLTGLSDSSLLELLGKHGKEVQCQIEAIAQPPWALSNEFPPQIELEIASNNIRSPMFGRHAAHNIALAVEQSRRILEERFSWPSCIGAVARAQWEGRMHFLNEHLLISGDHNEEGWLALVENLKLLSNYDSFTFFVALGKEKSFPRFFEIVNELNIVDLFVYDQSFNAKPIAEYPKVSSGLKVQPLIGLNRIKQQIDSKLHDRHLNVVTGSLYFVGEVIGVLKTNSL